MMDDEKLRLSTYESSDTGASSSFALSTTARRTSSEHTRGVGYRIAASRKDLEAAYRLVHQEYLRRGYIEEHSSALWLSVHNALPESTTLLMVQRSPAVGESIVGTVTLVPDSPLGLPMDAIYRGEMDRLRRAGRRIGEVTMLAFREADGDVSDGASTVDRCRVLFRLFKLVWNEARCRLGLDDLCIAIHPTHSLIYEQIGFQDFAPIVAYDRVNGSPALGKRVDLRTVRARLAANGRPSLYRFFFEQAPMYALGRRKFLMTPEDLAYFCVERTDVLTRASRSAIQYLLGRYRYYYVLQSL